MHHRITFSSPRAPPLHCCATKIELIKLPQRRMPCLHRCALSSLKSQTEEEIYTAAQASSIPATKQNNELHVHNCMHASKTWQKRTLPSSPAVSQVPTGYAMPGALLYADGSRRERKESVQHAEKVVHRRSNEHKHIPGMYIYVYIYTSTRSTLLVSARFAETSAAIHQTYHIPLALW